MTGAVKKISSEAWKHHWLIVEKEQTVKKFPRELQVRILFSEPQFPAVSLQPNQLAGPRHGFVTLVEVRAGLAGRSHVLGAGPLENLLGFLCPLGIVGVHGKENASL